MNNVYTLKETANILKTSGKTTQKLIDSGKLNAFKIGQQWRVAESSIDEYVEDMIAASKRERLHSIEKQLETSENEEEIVETETEIATEVEVEEKEEPPANIAMMPITDSLDIDELIKLGFTYQQIADQLNSHGSLTERNKAWTKKNVVHQIEKIKKDLAKK